MTCSFIFFIEVDSVVCVDLSHKQGEVLGSSFYEQVIVVIHQAVVMDIDFIGFTRLTEYLQELLFIFIASVDTTSCYTAVDYMVKTIEV